MTVETSDYTTVVGSIDIRKRALLGPSNGATWTLIENKSRQTGVPAFVRAAVLLKRPDEEAAFHSTFTIKASVDLRSAITGLFGSTPKDDPIFYDPSLAPTNKLRTYDTANLDAIDLDELSVVSFSNYPS